MAPPSIVNPSIHSFISPIMATNRSILSSYKRSEKSAIHTDSDRLLYLPNLESEGVDIIIYHPGSRNVRLGIAKDPLPRTIMHVIARKKYIVEDNKDVKDINDPCKIYAPFPCVQNILEEEERIKIAETLLEKKAKYIKKKTIPNVTQQMLNFNRNVQASLIPKHNDAFSVDWTDIQSSPTYVVGKNALQIQPKENYSIHFPMTQRHFYYNAYPSLIALSNDLETVLIESLASEYHIKSTEFSKYFFALVVPDLITRVELKEWLNILFKCGFKSVLVIQESNASTYGAGLGSACVVDMGAESTSIALVEDGFIANDSKQLLPFGGDHLVSLFDSFLKLFDFPYHELSLTNPNDFDLLTELKERTCTLVDTDISVSVIDFYVRQPGEQTRSFQFKSYDERYLVLLAFFEPLWLCLKESKILYPEDLEEISFDRVTKGPKKPTADETEGQAEDAEIIVDDASSLSSVSLQTTSIDLSTVENTESILQEDSILRIPCHWQSCSIKGDLEVNGWIEHILRDHCTPTHIGFRGHYQCFWKGSNTLCSRTFDHLPAFKTHLMTHVLDEREKKEPKKVKIEEEEEENDISNTLIGLDEAIVKSILAVETSQDRMKRWLGSILFVGGSSQFSGLSDILEYRLRTVAAKNGIYVTGEDRLGVIRSMRETDVSIMAWKGASVMARLESAREFWITEKEWTSFGMRIVNERYPFMNV